jgi:hypothetical protein
MIDSQMSFGTWCPPASVLLKPFHHIDVLVRRHHRSIRSPCYSSIWANIGRAARGRRRAGRTLCRPRPN